MRIVCSTVDVRPERSPGTVFTGVSLLPSRLNTIINVCCAFRRKIINSVFLTFKECLLAFRQCDKLLRSWFNFLVKTSSDLADCRIFASSARWYALEYLTHLFRLFMHIRKRRGPRTEFWGTPVKIVLAVELQFSINKNCFLFVR